MRGLIHTLVAASALLVAAARAEAVPVTATWDPTGDRVTVGYRLYYGTAPGTYTNSVDVGNVTSFNFDAPPGRLFFVVRAYNADGDLGPASNEAFLNFGNNQPPSVVSPGDLVVPAGPVAGQLPAFDPDGDPLVFAVSGLPGSMAVNPSTGVVSGVLPPGVYSVTVTVSDGQLSSHASFRITAAGGGGACAAPLPATFQPAAVNGNQVALTWTGGEGPASSYVLEVGTGPGQANLAVVELPASTTSVSSDAPSGNYFARVRSRNACGEVGSNEITFSVGQSGGVTPVLSARRSGGNVTLSWTSPPYGRTTSWLIEVGTSPGASMVTFDTGSTATSFTSPVPPGRYYVRVRAAGVNWAGPASNEVVVENP